jgi:cytochrome oxidase Cu insertion factor (SCO1/SenC/PrrC family)
MTFLTGDAPTLQNIWTSYHVAVIPQASGTPQAGGGKVAHNDALFVIDQSGRERWLVDSDFTPDRLKKLVADLLSE